MFGEITGRAGRYLLEMKGFPKRVKHSRFFSVSGFINEKKEGTEGRKARKIKEWIASKAEFLKIELTIRRFNIYFFNEHDSQRVLSYIFLIS